MDFSSGSYAKHIADDPPTKCQLWSSNTGHHPQHRKRDTMENVACRRRVDDSR